ncbi:centromere protein H [Patagioenas fasciata monilis]|uniref:Centromere protein H n=1 Tax=Patagioenas fasciata monilis TaxID=372326 RepID=A0A1V4L1Y7_PATFA|nr:centromere protein H [Patagioenas fasciata monilis]
MEVQRWWPSKAAARGGPIAKDIAITQNIAIARIQKAVDVCMLLRLRDRMRQQLQDWSATLFVDQTPCLDHVIDEEYLQDAVDDLEGLVEELKLAFQNKTLALQRMQLGFELKNIVKQHDNNSCLVIGSMKHITMLSRTVIAYQQQTREKECKLVDIKRRRFALRKSGEQTVLRIRTMVKKIKEKQRRLKENKVLEKVCHYIQKERQRIIILQNVFQSILIGSRVNWAEDPSLKAIALQLEKNAYSM